MNGIKTKSKNMQRLSYIYTPLSRPYQYCSIADKVHNQAITRPHEEILIHRRPGGERFSITNGALEKKSTSLAHFLNGIGIKRQQYVGIVGPNSLEWAVGELAILKTGAVSVHLSLGTSDAKDAMGIIENVNCRCVVMDPGVDMVMKNPLLALQSRINEWNEVNPEKGIQTILLRFCAGFEQFPCLENILKIDMSTSITLPVIYPENTAVIFCTSGSMGKPKLVQINHFTLVNTVWELGEDDHVYYCDRPFAWLGGSPLFFLANGTKRLFVDSAAGSKDVTINFIWESIKQEKCTHGMFVPYQLSDICELLKKNKNEDYRMKVIETGGEIIGEICKQALSTVCSDSICIGYGSTESFAVSTKLIRPDTKFEPGDVGMGFPGVEIKIIQENGDIAFWGSFGEICVRSNCMSKGYLNAPELNKDLFTPDGWMRTGDIGKLDNEGSLIVVGRMKTVISRGTRKLIPAMIEEVIRKIPGVKEVYVIPVPDKRLLEEVCVCYVTDSENDITPDKMKDLCSHLFLGEEAVDGMGEAPTYFVKINDVPLLENGKVNKRKLREIAISQLGLHEF